MPRELSPDERALADYMSELSEEGYYAEWMHGLEFDLWRAVKTGPARYGRLDLTEEHLAALRGFAARCGGWIALDEEGEEGWVSFEEWERRFASS